MRVLLDESVPRRFGFLLDGHFVRTVQQSGWGGLRNGELLRAASNDFDVFVTADRNMQYQQNPETLPIAVVVLIARTNRLDDLQTVVPGLLARLANIQPGTFSRIEAQS